MFNDFSKPLIGRDLLQFCCLDQWDINLGYAIMIHKSQGSQWPKCILMLPSYASRMTDQSLLYTAVTRPSSELVMMGGLSLIQSAINMGNSSSKRITNITPFLYPDGSASAM